MTGTMNSLCVQEYTGQGSHNNRLLWFGLPKREISLTASQLVTRLASESAQQIKKKWHFTDRIVTYIEYGSYYITDKGSSR